MFRVNDFEDEMTELCESILSSSQTTDNHKEEADNASLLYDPDADDEDEKWANSTRARCSLDNKSDATLNCPCCMTLLCSDCQRHELYQNQYRAMFVYNCAIDPTRRPAVSGNGENKRSRHDQVGSVQTTYELVVCKICRTQVAAYDPKEEMYHFYNAISGH